jgi:transposase InsO family protein
MASVLDLGSRRLLGYSMADHMRTELVLDALAMAVAARDGIVAGVIAHADRGSQYTSNEYLDFCHAHQLRASVGRVGDSFDCEHDGVAVQAGLTLVSNDFVSLR